LQHGELLLADITVLRLERLPEFGFLDIPLLEGSGGEHIRAGVHRLAAQGSDAGLVEHPILLLDLLRLPSAVAGPHQLPAGGGIGGVHVAGRLEQPALLGGWYVGENASIQDDGFQQFGGGPDPVEEARVASLGGGADLGLWHGAKSNGRLRVRQGRQAGPGIALSEAGYTPIDTPVPIVPEDSMVGNRLVFLALAVLVGCGRERPGNAAGDDSTRDLQRPAVDASAPMNDRPSTAKTTTKVAAKPAPKPAAKPAARVLAAGTAIPAKFDAGINSRTHKAGQMITGTVSADVKDKSGRVVIPAGSRVHVTIAAIHESERKSDKTGKLVLTPTKVVIGGRSYPLTGSASALDRTLKDRKTNAGDIAKVGMGVGAGALLGTAVSGGSTKGAVIGGIAGGAVGTQRAIETQDRDVVVPVGSRLKVTLATPFRRSI
jgi:uncharacterized protein YcfJ